ncbi:hypothetical protein J5N97_010265 [Dioscorea zingiberensis]|uniref:Uncharacterized protein n=1 Tax=Dioscorea zingiberensis TaxID=325984 RepID=A0A9D5CY36_9LILI|nr:hypothetical protein J5N97_010265 [Dioscorea zingiberensis]
MESPHASSAEKPSPRNANPSSPSPSPSSRLWRPAAQRNIRNQWSKLLSGKDRWFSAASEGRNHATSLVNAYLSCRYMPHMDLGVLKGMPRIREKACEKLTLKQELYCGKLLSSYKDMVAVVSDLVKASKSMRCFIKGSAASSLIQFSDTSGDMSDPGDGGGIPVFTHFSISEFENLVQEIVEMFELELSLKRLIVVELLSINEKEVIGEQIDVSSWQTELYLGEFDNLQMIGLLSEESFLPLPSRLKDRNSNDNFIGRSCHQRSSEILQVYLTTWLADVNIDVNRIAEIFSIIEEEIQVKLS